MSGTGGILSRISAGTWISVAIALCGGGLFLYQQAVSIHDTSVAMQAIAKRIDSIETRQNNVDAERASRYLELKLAVMETKGQVDAIRAQQLQSVEAVRATQQRVEQIANVLGANASSGNRR